MIRTPGRTQFDVMTACKQITTKKFASHKLKDLAYEILNDKPHDYDEKSLEPDEEVSVFISHLKTRKVCLGCFVFFLSLSV